MERREGERIGWVRNTMERKNKKIYVERKNVRKK